MWRNRADAALSRGGGEKLIQVRVLSAPLKSKNMNYIGGLN